jgi:ABC-type nitrate/sulfonate/bicarbonate transport system permease component
MDTMNLLGLTCAVLAALAFGVLLAYNCCRALFALLHMHSRSLPPVAKNNAVEPQVLVS